MGTGLIGTLIFFGFGILASVLVIVFSKSKRCGIFCVLDWMMVDVCLSTRLHFLWVWLVVIQMWLMYD
jgi:hypothetical protein